MVKRRILSTGLALVLAVAVPVTALADSTDQSMVINDGAEHTIKDSIEYTGDKYALEVKQDGTKVTAEGNVKAEMGSGIVARNDSVVTVKGDVRADKVAINSGGSSTTTVEGDVVGTGSGSNTIQAGSQSTVTVKGDVISEDTSAIRTDNEAHVSVGGDIEAGNAAISAWGWYDENKENTTVSVDGNVHGGNSAIDATNGADVTVGGNVSSGGSGIYSGVYDPSTFKYDPDKDIKNKILVNGNVTVTTEEGHYDYMGVGTWNNSDITIVGTLTVKDDAGKKPWAIWSEDSQVTVGDVDSDAGGVQAGGNNGKTAGIHVKGDLEAGDGYYTIQLWGSDVSTVLVGNDVKIKNDGDVFIDVSRSSNEQSEIAVGGAIKNKNSELTLKIATDSDGNASYLPEIVVGEIENVEQLTVVDEDSEEVSEETAKQVLENIKYIVSSNPDSMEGKGSFQITKLDGSALSRDKSNTYDVAETYETITVHVDVQSGYEVASLTAGKSPVVKNADGSYSITIQPGGGINIEALIKAIEKEVNPDDKPEKEPEPTVPEKTYGKHDSHSVHSLALVWKQGSDGRWTYNGSGGRKVRSQWMLLEWNGQKNWYYFGSDTFMKTGWFQDHTGNWYYLNPKSDGFQGAMRTGWQQIDGEWFYFNTAENDSAKPFGSLILNQNKQF